MAPSAPATETEKFLFSILKRTETSKLDWAGIARENGLPTSNAAAMRWYRFRSKMDPEGSKTPRKTPGKKKAAMPVSEPGSPTPAAKKRKREDIKIEAEEEATV